MNYIPKNVTFHYFTITNAMGNILYPTSNHSKHNGAMKMFPSPHPNHSI